MLRTTVTAVAIGTLAMTMHAACGGQESTSTPAPAGTAAPPADPNPQEFVSTLRSQGFQEADAELNAQGAATCALLGQFDVKTAIDQMYAGAVTGLTGPRNVQVMAWSAANYLCPKYDYPVTLVLGEDLPSPSAATTG